MKVYLQRNLKWSSILLGLNTDPAYTIGWYGCLLCCVSELAGVPPDVMNTALIKAHGFLNGGEMIFGAIHQACLNAHTPRIVTFQSQSYEYRSSPFPAADIQLLKTRISSTPVLLEVDSNPSPKFAMHWVLGVAWPDSQLIVDDPWNGDRRPLCPTYGEDVPTALVRTVYVDVQDSEPTTQLRVLNVNESHDLSLPLTISEAL